MIQKSKKLKIKLAILIGPPGSGKGTQAEMLSELNYFHIETSKLLEEIVRSKEDSPLLKKLREQFFSGKLLEPEIVAEVLVKEVEKVSSSGRNIVLSGSPRTLYEAEAEMPIFERIFLSQNIHIFNIQLSDKEAIDRNSNRRICSVCRYPVPNFKKYKDLKNCLKCGAKLVKRELDNLTVMKERLIEYKNRTEPILDFLQKQGFKIIKIKGNQKINSVHKDIIEYFK